MKKELIMLLAATFLTFSTAALANEPNGKPIVMGYWTNWGTYKGYPVGNPDFNEQMAKLDILAYAFFEVDGNGNLYFSDPWSDLTTADVGFCNNNPAICRNQSPQGALGNFTKLTKQKLYPNVKIVISIGGAGHDVSFYNAFANPVNFINSLDAIVKEYKIDGVDLDFEPSAWGGKNDPEKYVKLTQDIRNKFPDHNKLLLTSAVSASPEVIKQFQANNWKKFAANVDYIGIMAYDLHGGFDGIGHETNFHSNLYSDNKNDYSGDSAVQTYIEMGIPAKQLILGVPAYGRVLGGVEAGDTHGLHQIFHSLYSSGDLGEEMESYKSIVGTWLGRGFTDYYYQSPSVPGVLSGVYAYDPGKKLFVSFDNTALIDAKANYVKKNNLAGLMIWEIRADIKPSDPNNASLIKHMYDGLKK